MMIQWILFVAACIVAIVVALILGASCFDTLRAGVRHLRQNRRLAMIEIAVGSALTLLYIALLWLSICSAKGIVSRLLTSLVCNRLAVAD